MGGSSRRSCEAKEGGGHRFEDQKNLTLDLGSAI